MIHMAGLNQTQILEAAEKIVLIHGMEKARLSDVADELGVSHAALYKHFKDKTDLFETLATSWLERTESKVLNYKIRKGEDRVHAMYRWLSLLSETKRNSFKNDSKMFRLYTIYISRSEHLLNRHLERLRTRAEEILGIQSENGQHGMALILAFEYFHNPMFCEFWNNPGLDEYFESVWKMVEPGVRLLVKQGNLH